MGRPSAGDLLRRGAPLGAPLRFGVDELSAGGNFC